MKTPVRIFKFGGSSVGDLARIRLVARLVAKQIAIGPLVVITSAMAGVTDRLLELAGCLGSGAQTAARQIQAELAGRHRAMAASINDDVTRTEIEHVLTQLDRLFEGQGDRPAARLDAILSHGERLCAPLIAGALRAEGVDSASFDATTFFLTTSDHGDAWSLGPETSAGIERALTPFLGEGGTPVVTGYCGVSLTGHLTTLGRGGSDSTATIIGEALNVASVTLWSDVAGVMTADPRVVSDARIVPHLSYREAAELSFHGAKVLHPRAMIPVAEGKIPVWCKSTFHPDLPGTLIDHKTIVGSEPVKACSVAIGYRLMTVEGKGMAGTPGVGAAVLQSLADSAINVVMISQACSEISISIGVSAADAEAAKAAIEKACASTRLGDAVESVVLRDRPIAMIAAVGSGMVESPGVAARFCAALAQAGINIVAVAQGGSEWNLTAVIDEFDAGRGLQALHTEYRLNRLELGVPPTPGLDVIIVGMGQIARRVLGLVQSEAENIWKRFGLRLRVVSLVDRSGYVLRPEGLSGDDLDAAIFAKENGRTLASLGNAQKGDANAAIEHALTYRFVRPVVIDVTDDPKMASPLGRARMAGADLITANKGPIADSADDYRTLMSPGPCITRAEATVGAGLPILNTLGMLVSTGDTLERIEGSLSGTLGFVLDQMNDDISLSDAVKTAVERGYTEPDPCVDLSGSDVLRKAIILSRMAGWEIPTENISLDGFVPGLTPGKDKAGLLEELMAHDQAYQSRLEAARRHSACLRYVASVTPDRIIVGLEEVPGDHPLSGLRGTDNMVVFTSQRYAERPLVVMGPGAGPQVTAMGVFGDLVRIAGERAVKRG